jgi:hypothetical protein
MGRDEVAGREGGGREHLEDAVDNEGAHDARDGEGAPDHQAAAVLLVLPRRRRVRHGPGPRTTSSAL